MQAVRAASKKLAAGYEEDANNICGRKVVIQMANWKVIFTSCVMYCFRTMFSTMSMAFDWLLTFNFGFAQLMQFSTSGQYKILQCL